MIDKYRYIVYNCGYNHGIKKDGVATGKKYRFMKRMVTKVDPRDGIEFCKMTSSDIQWCEKNDRSLPPFMTADDWCNCKKGTYASSVGHRYDVESYIKTMKVE